MEEGHESYDTIVVGSGYGGSVAACRLSMAGIKTCLIEKGRRWEAEDFPTDSYSIMSAVRMDSRKWGFNVGAKNALFQIHEQDDSLVAVACGLGGGSLVNGGVLVPTPIRTRRDPKWLKEWNDDWDIFQSTASRMLGAQRVPIEFSNARVMKQVVRDEIEDYTPDSINLSINFGQDESSKSTGLQQMGNCLACGNCLSGCPYNAKCSTDKNYIASAIQAGCIVKTERQVLYVLENLDGINGRKQQRRRWRVYFDNLEYISADFVVLAAGVLGTVEILFHSERRGLKLSERLGFGFSCNGNNVAYLAGSQAPLNSHGVTKKQFSNVPFENRPGPAISSSYTSSLGYTIQSGVLPTSYPYLLFKGITTYGWPTNYWFFHGLIDKLKHLMGLNSSQAVVFNVMGYDECNGRITLDKKRENISIFPPHDPLLPKKIQALQKLTKKLGGILFMSRYRSTSVHLLGGCNAASSPSVGVCNSKGQVYDPSSNHELAVHEGLYICDASIIPCSVGINPCLTIAAVAEHVSRHIIQDVMRFKAQDLIQETRRSCKHIEPETSLLMNEQSKTGMRSSSEYLTMRKGEEVMVKETMKGFIGGMPCSADLVVKMNSSSQRDFAQKNSDFREPSPLLKGRVGGFVTFQAISKDKLYIVDGEVDMCKVDSRTPYTQYMHYQLVLAAVSGSRYILEGKKVMNPYLLAVNAWRESTTLQVTFKTLARNCYNEPKLSADEELVDLKGELHISFFELLKSLISLKGKNRGTFLCLLLQSLWRTYILQVPRERTIDITRMDTTIQDPYPQSIFHELKTEDGYIISCQQWNNNSIQCRRYEQRKLYPVLLLNGHSESYYLPTEPRDLIRNLLEEGHETWLLQPRFHPSHASNNFTLEDIGRFDIPAAIARILELHAPGTKIHVIAHCVGGLAIHIALLGGHISAVHIASLSCTNTSMYFKLTNLALFKMRLPLIPVSMALLQKNRILSLSNDPKDSLGHRIIKFIVRQIPRPERCRLNECELFSGIFGNAFWHENVSEAVHQWLIKQNLPRLPLSAFPHLRKICTTGFIVDSKGRNNYLIHPERMPIPTLYISGGRTLLVTPETSFLANKYMTLHHPDLHHKRLVVEGFGHSDLLIGEKAYERVFPHFMSHMRLAEDREGKERNECNKDSMLLWDGSHDGDGHQSWSSLLCLFSFFCVCYFIFFLISMI
ncbi:uncharacterized protein [Typha angustifolia]|uniref:uncharacterized protein isoform X2 n=1 Tax=Typha angustifolia TaxID=59011 RepID=UPI003C2DCE6B